MNRYILIASLGLFLLIGCAKPYYDVYVIDGVMITHTDDIESRCGVGRKACYWEGRMDGILIREIVCPKNDPYACGHELLHMTQGPESGHTEALDLTR